jgi:hypothetical protein
LVVRDLVAFESDYGTNRPVAGVFANGSALSNGGERLRLEDGDGATIQDFVYDDRAPWPTGGDTGYSLVLVAPETNPDASLPANWRASRWLGGSPGRPEVAPPPANPVGDANRNGEPDLIDYVLGNDLGLPTLLPRLALQPDPLGGSAALRLICPAGLGADGAVLGISFSRDLVHWQDAAPWSEFVMREAIGGGREMITWRVQPPLRNEPQVFLRVRATPR